MTQWTSSRKGTAIKEKTAILRLLQSVRNVVVQGLKLARTNKPLRKKNLKLKKEAKNNESRLTAQPEEYVVTQCPVSISALLTKTLRSTNQTSLLKKIINSESPMGSGKGSEECGDAMDYLYPAMGSANGSAASSGSSHDSRQTGVY